MSQINLEYDFSQVIDQFSGIIMFDSRGDLKVLQSKYNLPIDFKEVEEALALTGVMIEHQRQELMSRVHFERVIFTVDARSKDIDKAATELTSSFNRVEIKQLIEKLKNHQNFN